MTTSVKDLCVFTKKAGTEIITPHRLIVGILIQEFCQFRKLPIFDEINKSDTVQYRHGFCLLTLKLLQSPDINLQELRALLHSSKYTIHPVFISEHFEKTLAELNATGTDCLLDIIGNLNQLINPKENDSMLDLSRTLISRNSVAGYFCRRLLISLNKLLFSEITAFVHEFRQYYRTGEEDLEQGYSTIGRDNPQFEDWYADKDQWTRRQAELFIATQAAMLTNNEERAINPVELHKHIQNILKSNPDLAEAHFLSYLNYLRIKEFCGAIDSLYHCFDKNAIVSDKPMDEKSKGYRFAALNLAVLHYHFRHREEALAALKEAVKISQEANDNICLQHALSWLHCLTLSNKDKLIEHSILKSLELNLSYTMSFGIQCFVQYAGMTSGKPKQIFETITKSDVINCQENHRDLISTGYTEKSCLWLLYGKTQMSSLWSQLFLNLTIDSAPFNKTIYAEGFCNSVCNIANQLLLEGEYLQTDALLGLAREKFPNEPNSHAWILCENVYVFTRALHHEDWSSAESAAHKIAVMQKWESYLRLAELYLYKEDFAAAHKCVSKVLNKCQSGANARLRIDFHVRTLILLAEIQCASNFPDMTPSGVAVLLNSCLSYANDYHLDYYAAVICMHVANLQLLMGMPAQALKLIDQSMVQILAHGGRFDRARVMFLYVKCVVANSGQRDAGGRSRNEVVLEAADMLDKVRGDFEKVEAYSRVKVALYLQAQLYHEVGCYEKRNKCALEYRILDEEYPSKNVQLLLNYF